MVVSKKNLVAAAVANALLFVGPAYADGSNKELTIYGTIGAAVESLDNGSSTTSNTSNNHSVLGLEGSIGIKNKTQAIFHYDVFLDIDGGGGNNSGGSLFGGGRDGYVGLRDEDSWGTVALGFQGRPWKTSTAHLDQFEGTIADYSAILGSTGDANTYFDGGISSSIIWFGPRLGGFSWHAQYGADENDDDSNDYGVQVNYKNGHIYASISYDVDGRNNAGDVTAIKGAFNYSTSGFSVTGIYEQIDDGPNNDRDAYYLAGSLKLNNSTRLKAAAAVADDLSGTSDSGAKYFALGVSHELFKDVEVYAFYSQINNDTNGSYSYVSQPHTTSNTNTGIAAAGDDSDVVVIGIKYNFKENLL